MTIITKTKMQQQTYYLISQEEKEEKIMSQYEFIDPDHMNNIFEVIKVDNNVYKIIKIYKNKGLNGNFKPDDIIYFEKGMISFFTKNNNDQIDQIECFPTVLIEKEKITFFNETIDTKIDELINLIDELENDQCGFLIDKKYSNIKNSIKLFH